MKRGLCFGFMAVVAAGTIFFGAQTAHALVKCQNVPGTSSWPYNGYTQYCGSALPDDGGNMANVLRKMLLNDRSQGSATNEAGYILSHYSNKLGDGARFWVFGAPDEFSQYCNQNQNGRPNSALFGYPYPGVVTCAAAPTGTLTSGNITEFTLIIKSDLMNGKTVASATAHEAGHWLDTSPAYRILLGSAKVYSSDGNYFPPVLSYDWNTLNNPSKYNNPPSACNIFAPPHDSVFRGFQVEQLVQNKYGVWICANNGQGPGLTPGFSGSVASGMAGFFRSKRRPLTG
jgi:hypothetical protein